MQSGYSVPAEVQPINITGTPQAGLTCCPRYCNMPDVVANCTAPNLLSSRDANAACQSVDGQGNVSTLGTQAFKAVCPAASTFNGDRSVPAGSQPVMGSCGRGTNYNIKFCPRAGADPCQAAAVPAPAPVQAAAQHAPGKFLPGSHSTELTNHRT